MPEYHSLNAHVGTLQRAESLGAICRVETQPMLGRQRCRALALRRRMAITLSHRIHDANRDTRNSELDPSPTYHRRCVARESQRAPPIGDDRRRDTHRDDFRRPAEPGDAEGDAGRCATGTQRDDDRVGRRVELRAKLERREQVSDHRPWIGAATRDPGWRAWSKVMCRSPRAKHRPRQCDDARRTHHDVGGGRRRRQDAAARIRLGLRKERDGGGQALRPGVPRGRETVARSCGADGHKHRSRGGAGEQEFETAHLVAAALVFTFEPERLQSQRARERRLLLQRRRPLAETARRESGAYLCGQHCGAIHASDHRLHTSCGASRPQMRGRSAGGSPSGSRSGILQDVGQGAGTNRRRDGGAREAGVKYVDTPRDLAAFIASVRRESRVGVDTEAASFHRFKDRIYLLQISSPTQTALIDPVAIAATDLTPVGALLADPQLEKVFHDADYDLRVLDRDYGFHAVRLFDTRVAAQLAGEPAIGLAALLEKYVGVKLDKEHQKADWSLRPLTPPMLAYAAADTQHLLALRDALEQRLVELGRLAWAQEEFKQLEALRWTGPAAAGEEDSYLRLKGAKGLGPRSLAALQLLHRWRDTVAEREDKAPFRIIGNDSLIAVSRALPAGRDDLSNIRELPSSLARRHGDALLDAVGRAKSLSDSELPRLERRPRPQKDPGFDVRLERVKAVRNRVAAELGLEAGVLCGRTTLEAVVRARPADRAALEQVGELRRWQIDVLGDALLEALR